MSTLDFVIEMLKIDLNSSAKRRKYYRNRHGTNYFMYHFYDGQVRALCRAIRLGLGKYD